MRETNRHRPTGSWHGRVDVAHIQNDPRRSIASFRTREKREKERKKREKKREKREEEKKEEATLLWSVSLSVCLSDRLSQRAVQPLPKSQFGQVQLSSIFFRLFYLIIFFQLASFRMMSVLLETSAATQWPVCSLKKELTKPPTRLATATRRPKNKTKLIGRTTSVGSRMEQAL